MIGPVEAPPVTATGENPGGEGTTSEWPQWCKARAKCVRRPRAALPSAAGTDGTSRRSRPYASVTRALAAAAIAVGFVHYTLAERESRPGHLRRRGRVHRQCAASSRGGSHHRHEPDGVLLRRLVAGDGSDSVGCSRTTPHALTSRCLASEALLAAGSVVLMAQLCKWLFASHDGTSRSCAAAAAGLYPRVRRQLADSRGRSRC